LQLLVAEVFLNQPEHHRQGQIQSLQPFKPSTS
jgi:hypothetical protein